MIVYVARCDYPDCPERGPEAETATTAQVKALDAGWQRSRVAGDWLDLCPSHQRWPA